jgi:hypothetical protein
MNLLSLFTGESIIDDDCTPGVKLMDDGQQQMDTQTTDNNNYLYQLRGVVVHSGNLFIYL